MVFIIYHLDLGCSSVEEWVFGKREGGSGFNPHYHNQNQTEKEKIKEATEDTTDLQLKQILLAMCKDSSSSYNGFTNH
jgi:hypothetical protein